MSYFAKCSKLISKNNSIHFVTGVLGHSERRVENSRWKTRFIGSHVWIWQSASMQPRQRRAPFLSNLASFSSGWATTATRQLGPNRKYVFQGHSGIWLCCICALSVKNTTTPCRNTTRPYVAMSFEKISRWVVTVYPLRWPSVTKNTINNCQY